VSPVVMIPLLATTCLALAAAGIAMVRVGRLRETERSESYYRRAEQVGHIGHWRLEIPSGAVLWSDEMFKIFGLPKGTVLSLELKYSLYHPDDAAVRDVVTRAIAECQEWQVDHRIVRPDGELRHVKSGGVCERGARGEVVAIFGVLIDTTELELARREAEAAAESKADFLANMSHEIRTPMNGVMGFVELLMDSKLDAKQRRHLQLVQESAQVLLKLLNDILDLSKIEAGLLDLSVEPSNIRHDITQCVRLMSPIAEQKGLELRTVFEDGFPESVLLDSLRLRQILFNLLGNAVKFTNEGSVTVTLADVPAADAKRVIAITVADTGVGIAEERKASIFDVFVQADASISRRFGGTGLGLSISRRLARLMGGTISLDSKENEGTTITLELPLDAGLAPMDRVEKPDRAKATASKASSRPASILLVEDIDINQELITEMLVRLGHRVEVAANGAEALLLAQSLEQNPGAWDMILMDIQMPVMDGLTATREIRALGGRAATIPIVALTANAFAAEMQECRDAGMNDHVAKPTGFTQLKQAVDLWALVGTSPALPNGFSELETGSVADRFEIRLLKSAQRLIELTGELTAAADESTKLLLMREAAGIAHVIAGTAGMFGRAPLGSVAQLVEAELKEVLANQPDGRDAWATRAVESLIAALHSTPVEPEAEAVVPARAA